MYREVEVVIIGAGPSGAAAAGELGRRGISTIVIEETDGVFREARLHNVTVRTMELARIWGIEKELRECGWPLDHPLDVVFMTAADGYELARLPWAPIGETIAPPESATFAQRCPQSWFNPILHRFAQRTSNVSIMWNTRFSRLETIESGVRVFANPEDGSEEIEIRARYVIAADGARSAVQRALGVGRSGTDSYGYSAEAVFRSSQYASIMAPRIGGRYIFVTEAGISCTINPFDGKDVFRVTLMAEPSKVSESDLIDAVHRSAGQTVELEVLMPLIPWVNRQTMIDEFRHGGVFFVGDAAHTWPPTGGFGANTGILDAFDIAWKLAAVLRGWGGEALLDSYDKERRLHAERMANIARGLYLDWFKLGEIVRESDGRLYADSSEGAEYRRDLGGTLVRLFRREFNVLGSSLGYHYEESPVILADGSEAPLDPEVEYHPTARPGHLMPHFWLEDGSAVIDHAGRGFVLFASENGGEAEEFRQQALLAHIPFEVVYIDRATALSKLGTDLVLMRPDGHVAWRRLGQTARTAPDEILRIASGR